MIGPPATDQEIEDWLTTVVADATVEAGGVWFDDPVWEETGPPDTCVISTSLNAATESDVQWGFPDYGKAKEICHDAGEALKGVDAQPTRDAATGEVTVRITGLV